MPLKIIALFTITLLFFSNAHAALNIEKRSDDEMYILEVRLGKFLLSDGALSYGNKNSVILPLSEVAAFLEFPIEVNAKEGYAEGWFISENRIFYLDLNKKEIIIAGEKLEYIDEYIELHEDDIFVDIKMLAKWFPIDFEFSLLGQSLALKSREKLPLELAYEREQNRGKKGGKPKERQQFPRKEIPFNIVSMPYIDVNMVTDYDSETKLSDVKIDSTFTADLLGLNTRLFLSTTNFTEVTSAQLRMGRKDPEGKLLGKLQASEFSIGDVFTQQLPLTSNSGNGRGVTVSTFPLQRVTEFDRITLRGDVQPNWEIEVFRNDSLLEFQKADDSGRYEFTNIPLLTGLNIIKLVFYGPFGEKREEIKRYLIDPELIEPGKSYYSVSAVQNDKELLPVGNLNNQQDSYGKGRFSFEYEYGLNNRTSLFAHLNSIPLQNGVQHNYITAGTSASISDIFGKYAISHDLTNGGNAFLVDLQTRVKDISLIAKHEQYMDFISETTGSISDPLERSSIITADGRFKLPLINSLGISLSGKQDKFNSGRTRNELSNRLSAYLKGTNLSNNLTYRVTNSDSESNTTFNGDLLISTLFNDLSVRGGVRYSISPETTIDNLTLSSDYKIDDKTGLRAGITHSLSDQQLTSYSLGINSKQSNYNLGLNGTYDDTGEFNIGMSLSLAVGQNPTSNEWELFSGQIANKAILSSRIFIDNDGDGVFSDGDSPLDNAGLKINGSRLRDTTDKRGLLLSSSLQPDRITSIQIDESTIEDPYLVSLNSGVDVIPRSGVSVRVDFPLVPTGEIEGVVYRKKDGSSKEVSSVILELVDIKSGNIIKETKTAYDGFYLFELVPPGEYIVRISAKQLERLKLSKVRERRVVLGYDSPVINGADFTITN